MQGGRGRGGRNSPFDFGDPFSGFGGFGGPGGHGSLLSSVLGGRNPFDDHLLGGRNPFDDPFFTRPFGGGMFDSSFFSPLGNPFMGMHHPSGFLEQQAPEPKRSRGPVIEEINSDDEEQDTDREMKQNPRKHSRSGNGPVVEDPDDDDEAEEKKSKHLQYKNVYDGFNGMQSQPQTHSFTFQSSSVSYGGANGAYYSSSKTRRTGSDGVTVEESKEADTGTRQATHKVSRALHNKGHSLTRKLKSDGMVDSMQTLHNLNEDELAGFEEAWKGKAQKHLPGWPGNFSGYENTGASNSEYGGGWALPSTDPVLQAGSGLRVLPSTDPSLQAGRAVSDIGGRVGSSRSQHPGRVKAAADVRDRSGYPRGRARDY